MPKVRILTHSLDMTSSPSPIAKSFESEKIIDHNNSSDRKWLSSHLFWAMRNGRRVIMTPESF
jgi:hypothetical protein